MNYILLGLLIYFIYLFVKKAYKKYKRNTSKKVIRHKLNEFKLGDKTLVWDYDEDENNVEFLPVDNLYIKDLWHMKDTIGEGQLCVGINILDDNNFSFTTFESCCYFLHIENNEVNLIERRFTK